MLDNTTPTATWTAPNLVELLRWVEDRPRTYGETIDAWRTSCPKLPAWEDAVDNGLVQVEPSGAGTYGQAAVRITPRGRAVLGEAAPQRARAGRRAGPEPLAPLSVSGIMGLMRHAYV